MSKLYRVHVHDYADQGRWLASADFPGKRPTQAQIDAAFPVLATPGRYEVRVNPVRPDGEEVYGWAHLQGEPWFRDGDGWTIKGYGADPGWHVSSDYLRSTPRAEAEKLYSLGTPGGLPPLPDEAWQRRCPVHPGNDHSGDCQWCQDVLAGRPITLDRTRAAMFGACTDCGCTLGPNGEHPVENADGNPYAQFTPEHRVWAKATEHGQAAASWAISYNDKRRCREVLTGIREGDPAVLDSIHSPAGDLSDGGDYTEADLLEDAGWVPHDGTALRDELTEQYQARVPEAFWHQVERDCIGQLKADPGDLNGIMEMDHVIAVDADGIVTEPSGSYAPELIMYTDEDDQDTDKNDAGLHEQAKAAGWQLLTGYSGQWRYSGPVMHPSEHVGGRLADHILENPGEYVVTEVTALGPTEDDDDAEPAGWAICYREPEQPDYEQMAGEHSEAHLTGGE